MTYIASLIGLTIVCMTLFTVVIIVCASVCCVRGKGPDMAKDAEKPKDAGVPMEVKGAGE